MNQEEIFRFHDDTTQKRLLQIIRIHVKLALEYGEPHISSERKTWIKQEIEGLREEREQLMRCEAEEGIDLLPQMKQ